MAETLRISWTTLGYWEQWVEDITVNDEFVWAQTFKPESHWDAPGDRFLLTKVRFKMWRTGEINSIGLVILPIKSYSNDGYNYYHRPDIAADPLGTSYYDGVIPESDPGDDPEDWIEFILDTPFVAEDGNALRGYAIIIYVDDGTGVLHWAYMQPKIYFHGCEANYHEGAKIKGVVPYELENWWDAGFNSCICSADFLFEIWGEEASVQVPTVQTLGYRLDQEFPHNCVVTGAVNPWCGAKVTNKGIRWFKDGEPETTFWKDIDVPDENYNYNNQNFTMELTDLEYDTKYYYRVEATNSAGVGVGEYVSFTSLYPETSLKVEIKAEAIATEEEIERVGPSETLLINNHLIQTKQLAQVIADYYLEQYKGSKIIIRGQIVTPAPYERRDAILFGEGEILNYTKAISAEIHYAAAVDAIIPYNYYDIATYGRMYIKKVNPTFQAGNYIASIELERK